MKSTRLATLCVALGFASFFNSGAGAQTTNAYDNGSGYSGGWANGANGGTGFGPWSINAVQGGGFSGAFLGNPSTAGLNTDTSTGGLPNPSFGLYANPNTSTADVSADRNFSGGALVKGQTFSLKWAVNYDAGSGGNKGFNLFSGGPTGTQLFNVNQGGYPGDITINGTNTSIGYGTNAMTWKFTMLESNTVQVTATARDGSTNVVFTRIVNISSAPDSFRLYASKMEGGDQRQPYFNDFLITTAPLDTDGDGTPDAEDSDIDGDGLANTVETNTGTFVSATDTGTNPLLADTDSDGYTDGAEVNGTSALGVATNPLKPNYATMAAPGNYAFSGAWVNNGSNNTAMTKAGEFGWTLTRNMTNRGNFMLKFVANSDWGKEWGRSASNNVASFKGDVVNFQVLASGLHTITFNNDTLAYTIGRTAQPATYADYATAYGIGVDSADDDGDQLTNQQEYNLNSNPLVNDTDGDNLTDFEEAGGTYGFITSPTSADTDNDGLPDPWEITYELDPLSAAGIHGGAGDPDGDGISNLLEFQANSNPRAAGTGFSKISTRIHLAGDFTTPAWTENPPTKILDLVPVANFTWRGIFYWGNSNAPVNKNYKLLSDSSWAKQWGTNATTAAGIAVRKDLQAGGVTDDPGALVATAIASRGYYVFELNEATGAYSVTTLAATDGDGDQIPDAWEVFYGAQLSTPVSDLDPTADSNGNGVTNLAEYQNGGNPVLDVTPPTIQLAAGIVKLSWVAKNGSLTAPAASDVTVTDDVTTGITPVLSYRVNGLDLQAVDTSTDSYALVTYTATDAAGNSASVNRVIVVGDLTAGDYLYYNLQYPPTISISVLDSAKAFAQIYVPNATPGSGQAPAIKAWIGVANTNNNPATWSESAWQAATYSPGETGGNDQYEATLTGSAAGVGTNYYASRFQIGDGTYFYGGITSGASGNVWNGTTHNSGVLTVNAAEITFANLQFPTGATISAGEVVDLYVRFYASLITDPPGAPTLGQVRAQVGASDTNSNPSTWASGSWVEASWNAQTGNNDEYKGTFTGLAAGTYYTASRFSLDGGATWIYGGINGVWNNDSGTITVSPAAPTGSTFAGWSAGATLDAANVGKYAIGGASSLSAASETPVSLVDSNTLSLSAIVRTNDAKLKVEGEAGGSLMNWSTNGVTMTASPNTNGVPEGHQRQVFSVERTNSPTRQFLRLKATLAP
jgi:hypothetical protein